MFGIAGLSTRGTHAAVASVYPTKTYEVEAMQLATSAYTLYLHNERRQGRGGGFGRCGSILWRCITVWLLLLVEMCGQSHLDLSGTCEFTARI